MNDETRKLDEQWIKYTAWRDLLSEATLLIDKYEIYKNTGSFYMNDILLMKELDIFYSDTSFDEIVRINIEKLKVVKDKSEFLLATEDKEYMFTAHDAFLLDSWSLVNNRQRFLGEYYRLQCEQLKKKLSRCFMLFVFICVIYVLIKFFGFR